METKILAVMLKERDAYSLIRSHIVLKNYGREFQALTKFIEDYYERDGHAHHVDQQLLAEQIKNSTQNDKHADRFIGMLEEAVLTDVSTANVKQVVLAAKQMELGNELAMAIASRKDHVDLLQKYTEIMGHTDLDDLLEKGIEVYDASSLDNILTEQADDSNRLMLYPLSLNERLEGGLRGTDHLTLFARPEQGKTACILTMAGGFARQGAKGIIFNNEESVKRLYLRQISNMTGMTAAEIRANPQAARDISEQAGFHNITFVSLSPGSLSQIEAYVERYEPRWFVVDQLRNLNVKAESRTNQLEAAATGIRNIAKRYNCVAISVTQAGDSAEGKAVLDMGDVDYSNTGIPAQCDVLLGIGSTTEQHGRNIRVFSLSKNKVSGVHGSFPVKLNPFLSKYVSVKE